MRTQVGKIWMDLPEGWTVEGSHPVVICDVDGLGAIHVSVYNTGSDVADLDEWHQNFLDDRTGLMQTRILDRSDDALTTEATTATSYWLVRMHRVPSMFAIATFNCPREHKGSIAANVNRDVLYSMGWAR
jgi:hypothetical protein